MQVFLNIHRPLFKVIKYFFHIFPIQTLLFLIMFIFRHLTAYVISINSEFRPSKSQIYQIFIWFL